MKFTNTLKNNVQLREEINSTKGTKQLQNKKTNIKYKNGLPITIDKQGQTMPLEQKQPILPPRLLPKSNKLIL